MLKIYLDNTMKEEKALIEIIRAVLAGEKEFRQFAQISSGEIEQIMACARKHGLLPFLQECPWFMQEPYRKKMFSYLKSYAYKDVRQMYMTEELFEQFEINGIFCMPLKGIRTKQFYPCSEMRTMGDLDILYKKEQTEKLNKLMRTMGFEFEGYNIKHDHYKKDGIDIEMHRNLLFRLSHGYEYFEKIWDRAKPVKGKQYIYEMSLEDHYLHTMYHLIEHFLRGGVGIRMVLDIYLLSHLPQLDREYVQRELEVLEIQKFEENIRQLGELWFGSAEKVPARTELLEELEAYVLSGGIFGSREMERRNGTILYQSKEKFLRQLFFPSYEVMKTACPWLTTPLLLPFAWISRYRRALTKERRMFQHHIKRMRAFDKADEQETKERRQFFEKCGLKYMSLKW